MVTWSMTIFPCSLTSFVVRGRWAWIFSNSFSFSVCFSITFDMLSNPLSWCAEWVEPFGFRRRYGNPPFRFGFFFLFYQPGAGSLHGAAIRAPFPFPEYCLYIDLKVLDLGRLYTVYS